MPVAQALPSSARRIAAALVSVILLALAMDRAVAVPISGEASRSIESPAAASLASAPAHLVVSEVMTGGASASDEFIELYNPTDASQPLEGLEVVYVTASGATVTRKATWAAGAPGLPAGAHLLIANSAGIFVSLADVGYANGLAATGGSIALRVVGAVTAIDAVGWGNATSSWLEVRPAPAPAAGSSLERLPGGAAGSSQDTDDNLVDFVVQPIPDPQNSTSPPISTATPSPQPSATPGPSATPEASGSPAATPSASPTPLEMATPTATATPAASATPTPSQSPTATPVPTATPTPTPSPTPDPTPISIAAARSQPDDSVVIVEGTALTASDFGDGGGYLVDATAGIAILISDGTFSRGQLMRVSGTLDDRFAQRTIRAAASAIVVIGPGVEPLPADVETGSVGEAQEGALVEVTGIISSSATTLSSGLAWDLDDGSGAIRVVVGTATGIDTAEWAKGVGLTLIGVVGQRDSTGSGTSGYRVQPRDPADIIGVEPVATPSPTPQPSDPSDQTSTPEPTDSDSASPDATASPTPSPAVALVSIAEARSAATNVHLRIRGVVTAQSGLLEGGSAVVQDSTAAILVRLGGGAGSLALGQLVELDGTRSTKAGMLSLRVTKLPLGIGTQADPEPLRRATGALGEAEEARLVIARGVVSTAVSRAKGGAVSFAIDDGSGPIRVTIASKSGIATTAVKRGAWLELRGVLGQQTTAKAPLKGYRLWPRTSADLRVIAAPVAAGATACCAKGKSKSDQLPPVGGGATGLTGHGPLAVSGTPPRLARPQPTTSPAAILMANAEHASPATDHRTPGAGLVISGMGLAALAGLAAWFSRRRDPGDASTDSVPATLESEPTLTTPRLALVRAEALDPPKERRILPPT